MANTQQYSVVFSLCIVLLSVAIERSHGQVDHPGEMVPYAPQNYMEPMHNYFTHSIIQENQMSLHEIISQLQNLNNNYLPMNLIRAKSHLVNYLTRSNVNVIPVAKRMHDIQNLDPLDKMIGLLLNIQQLIPLNVRVRNDLDQILAFVMMESYLNHVPMLGEMVQNSNEQTFVKGRSWFQDCDSSMELNRRLFFKLLCCERTVSNARCPPPQVVYVEKPVEPESRMMPEPIIQYVDKPCPEPTLPTVTTQVVTEMTTPSLPLIGMYESFVPYIPQPKNKWEETRYHLLKVFLERKDLGGIIGEMSFADGATNIEKLHQLLLKAKTFQWDEATANLIDFYVNSLKNMEALSFSASKEIKKKFDLTQIITDTLNFDTFTSEGKIAFGDFYTFISAISGQKLKGFTEWSDVKTKGEFMEVLFDYFLKHEDLINDKIKHAIVLLKPLINKDSAALLPP